MFINYLDSSTVKITLSAYEITELFGSYEKIDYKNKASKQIINKIINKAYKELNQNPLTEQLYIEVVPNILSGCSIYCTAVINAQNSENQSAQKTLLYEFATANSMIDAVCCLKNLNNHQLNVYKANSKYLLLSSKEYPPIEEFSLLKRKIDKTKEAYIKEHYKKIL